MANNVCPANMNLVMDDDYIVDVKTYIFATAQDANNKLDVLIKIVKRASTDGCIDGKTANALKVFSERASQLSGLILEYGKECVNLIENFREDIDRIDENLY